MASKLRRLKGLESNYYLTELYLQNNMLIEINGALQHLTCLKVLLLQGNQLTVLTDVILELRNMLNLENLNLFGNPLTQEYDYRTYVIHNIKSLKLLDRQAITREERVKTEKKYEIVKQSIKDTIAFGRRATTTDKSSSTTELGFTNSLTASCLRIDPSYANSSTTKQVQYLGANDSVLNEELSDKESKESSSESKTKEQPKRTLMQFNRFGWVDVLESRSKSEDKNTVPCIYTTKFR